MKELVVYYSRTGTTKKVAEHISKLLECDIEEIHETVNRSGFMGYLRAGRDAGRKTLTSLEKVKNDPAVYDVIIIGTPIWNHNLSTPIRTYITQYKANFRKIAFFCTQNTNNENTLNEVESLSGKKPIVTLILQRKEVEKDNYAEKIDNFVAKIKAEKKGLD